jgi:heme/copper-type cytochrome/quinol oxidase subunit 3
VYLLSMTGFATRHGGPTARAGSWQLDALKYLWVAFATLVLLFAALAFAGAIGGGPRHPGESNSGWLGYSAVVLVMSVSSLSLAVRAVRRPGMALRTLASLLVTVLAFLAELIYAAAASVS